MMGAEFSPIRGRVTTIIGVLVIVAPLAIAQDRPNALVDARQKFQEKQYREAIQVISAELTRSRPSNPRDAVASPQRYELLMLKGECLICIEQRVSASDAFTQAEKSASTPQEFALARASTLLVKASSNNKYPARTGGARSIDIVDPESRKIAFASLKEDRLAAAAPKLDRAKGATTLPPMFDVLDPMLDVAACEFAANGNANDTSASIMDLGARARGLINDELGRINARLNALEDASNSVVAVTGAYIGRRGLQSNEAQEVREFIPYLSQIQKTARDVRMRAQKLGFKAEAWEPIIADTGDLTDRAQAMLNLPA